MFRLLFWEFVVVVGCFKILFFKKKKRGGRKNRRGLVFFFVADGYSGVSGREMVEAFWNISN